MNAKCDASTMIRPPAVPAQRAIRFYNQGQRPWWHFSSSSNGRPDCGFRTRDLPLPGPDGSGYWNGRAFGPKTQDL